MGLKPTMCDFFLYDYLQFTKKLVFIILFVSLDLKSVIRVNNFFRWLSIKANN